MSFLKINNTNQKYFLDIKHLNPNIFSGRKNLSSTNKRVLKNILLTKIFNKTNNVEKFINKKIIFKKNKNYIFAYFD